MIKTPNSRSTAKREHLAGHQIYPFKDLGQILGTSLKHVNGQFSIW